MTIRILIWLLNSSIVVVFNNSQAKSSIISDTVGKK